MSVHVVRGRMATAMVAVSLTAAALVVGPPSAAVTESGRVADSASALTASAGGVVSRAAPAFTANLVRKTLLSELSPPAPDSSGIVYRSDIDQLLVVDSEVNEMPIYQGVNMWHLTRAGAKQETGTTLGFSKEPSGVSYDPVAKRVFISDDDRDRVFELTAGTDGKFGTTDDVVTSFSTAAMGNDDAEDVAYDTSTGDLFVTQGNAQEIWRVSPGANGRFDGVAPAGDDVAGHFDVGRHGSLDVEGLAYYPVRDSLFLADRKLKQIIEVTKTGLLMQTIDVTDIRMKQPAGITLAPSSDDATRTSMYVVQRGRDNNTWPDENDGVMYELRGGRLGPLPPNAAPTVAAGPDVAIQLPTSALLNGTVTDDGNPDPPGALSISWTQLSGPGPVTFSQPKAADTAASFTEPGTYELRLSATDSALSASDTVTVVVTGQPVTTVARCQGVKATPQTGPSTDDVLEGTPRVDLLRGMAGNDLLVGRASGDCLEGGRGSDILRGEGGKDVLEGRDGSDRLVGGQGDDRLFPGGGRDWIDAGGGADLVSAADGKRDVVRCGSGIDRAIVDARDRVSASCERVRVRSSRA